MLGRHSALILSSATPFLRSLLFVVLTISIKLDPIRLAADGPRLSQARHSGETISIRFGRCLRPGRGRSMILR
jgi:hypothetical protein